MIHSILFKQRVPKIAVGLSIISFMVFGLVACEQAEPIKAQIKSSDSRQADCFEQLHPGKVVGGKLQSVIFQHGACIGKYKALNKYTKRDEVVVMSEKGSTNLNSGKKSHIYISSKGVASVDTEEGKKSIGRLLGKQPDVALVLNSGVKFHLVVTASNGGLKLWELEDGQRDRKTEVITIYVP